MPLYTQEELFEKARGEVLDELVTLSQIDPRDWYTCVLLCFFCFHSLCRVSALQ